MLTCPYCKRNDLPLDNIHHCEVAKAVLVIHPDGHDVCQGKNGQGKNDHDNRKHRTRFIKFINGFRRFVQKAAKGNRGSLVYGC